MVNFRTIGKITEGFFKKYLNLETCILKNIEYLSHLSYYYSALFYSRNPLIIDKIQFEHRLDLAISFADINFDCFKTFINQFKSQYFEDWINSNPLTDFQIIYLRNSPIKNISEFDFDFPNSYFPK